MGRTCSPLAVCAVALAALAALAGACTGEVTGPKPADGECVVDSDCGFEALCQGGRCVPPLDIDTTNDPPPPSEGEGEGEPPPSEGEGEGEGEGEDPPPPPPPPPPSGPQRLTITAGPELVDALPGCGCAAPVSAANVDLKTIASNGAVCGKPADPTCGVGGPACTCTGGGLWGSGRTEEPRQPGESWIVDEQVIHDDGANGTFTVRASVSSDCLLSPGSLSLSTNYGCCLLDCEGSIGDGQACFDYSGGGLSCATFCEVNATATTNADCLVTGPVPVRVTVEATPTSGAAGGFTRQFCTTMSAADSLDVVEVTRTNGTYAIASVAPDAVEVAVGTTCN